MDKKTPIRVCQLAAPIIPASICSASIPVHTIHSVSLSLSSLEPLSYPDYPIVPGVRITTAVVVAGAHVQCSIRTLGDSPQPAELPVEEKCLARHRVKFFGHFPLRIGVALPGRSRAVA